MKNYLDLIEQTFYFPNKEFRSEQGELYFNEIRLLDIINQYGTPLKVSYLPKISENIQLGKKYFENAMKAINYDGEYIYSYCTKSSHFHFILEEVLKNDVKLELSSAFDVDIVERLAASGMIDKEMLVLCNGYKPLSYQSRITKLINGGFRNCVPILDSLDEFYHYHDHVAGNFSVGIRVAADEDPNFEIYTSRLGIRYGDVIPLYQQAIEQNERCELKLLHFFIHSGISDSTYYWSELNKFIYKYCELRQICPTLSAIDIGGGFPIKHSLGFEYDHAYMAEQIVKIIKEICDKNQVPTPDIITEFGNYTVGESGCVIYSVLDQKLQNDKELWYIIDGSLITQIPDIWGKNQKFIFLAINNLLNEYTRLHVGGLTCDSDDYYSLEQENRYIYLPKFGKGEKQYVGFFHTGAYQESLSGYGGIQHCLIPAPKHVLVNRHEDGSISSRLFREEQKGEQMMQLLGY